MPNSLRRTTPSDPEVPRNPNQPENDIGGAVGGARPRDENALSFRHFLQPHSDVVPLPPPCRVGRNGRGGIDLVDVTMALPDFVQDHLVMESLAAGEPLQDMSPSRPHAGHPLDLNVLNDILPEFNSSQRNSHRVSQSTSRRGGHEPPTSDAESLISHNSSALPDFLSDGPMQLSNDPSIINSPSSSAGNRAARSRQPLENLITEEPVRGPSFESKESLRLEIDRLRLELADKNRRVNQLDLELSRQRSTSANFETSFRSTERSLAEAVKRVADLEKQQILQSHLGASSVTNGHGDTSRGVSHNGIESQLNSSSVLNIARSSEALISQLMNNMEELKKLSTSNSQPGDKRKDKEKDSNFPR